MEIKVPIEKIELKTLLSDLRTTDEYIFKLYLETIWDDLDSRTTKEEPGIDKITFTKYYELPGMISERLFKSIDSNKNGYLEKEEFVEGMKIIFLEKINFKTLAKFIFGLYDFDNDGKISRDDTRLLLSYVPFSGKSANKILKTMNSEISFNDRIESQNELNKIINSCFLTKGKLTLDEFIYRVENINSDLFLFLLMYLIENKPFSEEALNLISLKYNPFSTPKKKSTIPPKSEESHERIASPSLETKYISPLLKKKTLEQRKLENKALRNYLKEDVLSKNPLSNFINKINTENSNDNIIKLLECEKKNSGETPTPKESEENNKNSNSSINLSYFNEQSIIKHEGYLQKITKKNNTLKKSYFKLIGKDIFFTKKKKTLYIKVCIIYPDFLSKRKDI